MHDEVFKELREVILSDDKRALLTPNVLSGIVSLKKPEQPLADGIESTAN
ncbi:hypothetical protein [Vibrio vulnificus]|nr:hypothetical protein [Vibrio vulnificus]